MSKKPLREQLVGAWVLTSYVVRDIKTALSAMATCRRNFNAPNDLCLSMEVRARATPDEFAAAGSSYIAYSGRFFIDEDENVLTHEMAVSLFPNWFGQRQVRLVEINGERLHGLTATGCPTGTDQRG
jgi:hypothetical protein